MICKNTEVVRIPPACALLRVIYLSGHVGEVGGVCVWNQNTGARGWGWRAEGGGGGGVLRGFLVILGAAAHFAQWVGGGWSHSPEASAPISDQDHGPGKERWERMTHPGETFDHLCWILTHTEEQRKCTCCTNTFYNLQCSKTGLVFCFFPPPTAISITALWRWRISVS